MKFKVRLALLAVSTFAVAGCSGSGGLLDNPSGNITITDTLTGQVLSTSEASPYLVPDLRFSININEDHFGGPYNVVIIKQENVATPSNNNLPYPYSFNEPCFTPHAVTGNNAQANTYLFSGDIANGKPGNFTDNPNLTTAEQSAGGNPCHSGELEVAQISDSRAHSVLFYYEEYP